VQTADAEAHKTYRAYTKPKQWSSFANESRGESCETRDINLCHFP